MDNVGVMGLIIAVAAILLLSVSDGPTGAAGEPSRGGATVVIAEAGAARDATGDGDLAAQAIGPVCGPGKVGASVTC